MLVCGAGIQYLNSGTAQGKKVKKDKSDKRNLKKSFPNFCTSETSETDLKHSLLPSSAEEMPIWDVKSQQVPVVVDVGGGKGHLLMEILRKHDEWRGRGPRSAKGEVRRHHPVKQITLDPVKPSQAHQPRS